MYQEQWYLPDCLSADRGSMPGADVQGFRVCTSNRGTCLIDCQLTGVPTGLLSL